MEEHYILENPSTEPIRRRAHYDVRKAAHNYSNIGAFLAGFALAAIVLISQTSQQLLNVPNGPALRDLAGAAFLVGFFGCVIAAFVFAVVSAEEILAPRTHGMAFFAGTGFALSTLFLFWGIATLTKLLLPNAVGTAYALVVGIGLIAPLFLTMGIDDSSIAFDHLGQPNAIPRSPHILLWVLAYVPISLAMIVRFGFGVTVILVPHLYAASSIGTLGVIVLSAWLTLRMSDYGHNARVTPWEGRVAVTVYSIYASTWIILLP